MLQALSHQCVGFGANSHVHSLSPIIEQRETTQLNNMQEYQGLQLRCAEQQAKQLDTVLRAASVLARDSATTS